MSNSKRGRLGHNQTHGVDPYENNLGAIVAAAFRDLAQFSNEGWDQLSARPVDCCGSCDYVGQCRSEFGRGINIGTIAGLETAGLLLILADGEEEADDFDLFYFNGELIDFDPFAGVPEFAREQAEVVFAQQLHVSEVRMSEVRSLLAFLLTTTAIELCWQADEVIAAGEYDEVSLAETLVFAHNQKQQLPWHDLAQRAGQAGSLEAVRHPSGVWGVTGQRVTIRS